MNPNPRQREYSRASAEEKRISRRKSSAQFKNVHFYFYFVLR